MEATNRNSNTLAAVIAAVALVLAVTPPGLAQSLRGTKSSLSRQNSQARQHDFTFLTTGGQVRRMADQGYLVQVRGNSDYFLKEVSFPYTRPEVKLFIERLSRQYHGVCDEQLVVTSLTRPRNHQPRNASARSVHPTGMALDLRRSWSRKCRSWLEGVLLSLENQGVLEATFERWPPHYHIAVFPRPYKSYVESLSPNAESESANTYYRVNRGDTLWKIASRYRTTVESVKRSNGLRSNRIMPGQVLKLPAGD